MPSKNEVEIPIQEGGPVSSSNNPLRDWIRDHWPTLLLALTLVAVVVVILIGSTQQAAFCVKDEAWAACIRNWINAAGNVFAFVAASFAAYYAFGQFKAANKQAAFATLPSVEDRLRVLNQVDWVSSNFLIAAVGITSHIESFIDEDAQSKANIFDYYYHMMSVKRSYDAISESDEEIRRLLKEQYLDEPSRYYFGRLHEAYVSAKAEYIKIREFVDRTLALNIEDPHHHTSIQGQMLISAGNIDKFKWYKDYVENRFKEVAKVNRDAKSSLSTLEKARARILEGV